MPFSVTKTSVISGLLGKRIKFEIDVNEAGVVAEVRFLTQGGEILIMIDQPKDLIDLADVIKEAGKMKP